MTNILLNGSYITTRDIDSTLTRPDGTIREGYTLGPGELVTVRGIFSDRTAEVFCRSRHGVAHQRVPFEVLTTP